MQLFLLTALLLAAPVQDTRPIEVTLSLDKGHFIRGEPLRLSATALNRGAEPYEIVHPRRAFAAAVEFHLVGEDGESQAVRDVGHASRPTCLVGADTTAPLRWRIAAGASVDSVVWQRNHLAAGSHRARAVFIPQHGPDEGQPTWSNDVTFTVSEPVGADRAAHDVIFGTALIDTSEGPLGPSFLRIWLNRRNPTHGGAARQAFLAQHADSLYARYIEFNGLDRDHGNDRAGLIAALTRFIAGAPEDLPLLADTYRSLLDLLRREERYEDLARFGAEFRARGITTGSPPLRRKLETLLEVMPEWPPVDPDRKALVARAETIWARRTYVEGHWLVKAMEERHVRSTNFTNEVREITRTFGDGRQSWALHVKFLYYGRADLPRIMFHGSLESFLVGELTDFLGDLARAHGLSTAEALETFVYATIERGVIHGELTLPGGERKTFRRDF